MKTKLSLALLTMLIAAGCSESDQSNLPDSPVNAVPIRIGQSVSAVSRAVAENGTSVTATILRCDGDTPSDWSGFTKVDKNVINDSKQLTDRASVSAASFVVGTTQEISIESGTLLSYGRNDQFICCRYISCRSGCQCRNCCCF